MRTTLVLAALLTGSCPLAARAQDYGSTPHTYYLHAPSSYQSGCWGPCACAITAEEPMRGTFTLALANIGNATDFYTISNVHWTVPMLGTQPFGEQLTGAGTFAAGQVPFNTHQFASLDLTLTPPSGPPGSPQQFQTTLATMTRTVPPPVISMQIANSTTGCPGVRLWMVASWYRTDWDASGTLTVADILGFLNAWFAGNPLADDNGIGGLDVQDIFDFLNGWFAGADVQDIFDFLNGWFAGA